MDLAATLREITSLPDLPRLVAALGHEPLWEEIPVAAWGFPPRTGVRRSASVGRVGTFRWIGLEAADANAAARWLAGRLGRRARAAGVIALAPAGRRLALAVAWGRNDALAIALDHPGRLELCALRRLAGAGGNSALAFTARAAEALSTEGISDRFFAVFRATLDRMSAGIPDVAGETDRRELALLQLTRVLFLYIVQSKGWLDGRDDFLRAGVDAALGARRSIHRHFLRPLFFGTLNRRADERGRLPTGFGHVPFLNGGLFEPHALERRWRTDIPNPLWRDAFDDLFERFHFTADESDGVGAVAPDMLGRVFERLMAPGARRTAGAYYTPPDLVRRLVDAGLAAALARHPELRSAKVREMLDASDERLGPFLQNVTILDPAVGSGAFLLGALERLAELRRGEAPPAALKREILRRNLFGVDLDPTAVRLSELRLWLSVVADDPAQHPGDVTPLPNLDCLVRQGDSLLDPLGGQANGTRSGRQGEPRLAAARRRLVTAIGADKREAARELRREEWAAAVAWLHGAEAASRRDIAEILCDARAPTLLEAKRGLDRELRERLRGTRERLRQVRTAARRLARDGRLPWFHYESHFADVFAGRGGFDLIVGNPPWVRAEQIPPAMRERLAARYRWWRAGGGPGFRHLPDLALAFVERAWELAAREGAVALLVPAKLATAGYATATRRALASRATLHAVADLTAETAAAFDATVYPLALVFTRQEPPERHGVRLSLGHPAAVVPQAQLSGAPWLLATPTLRRALNEVRADHPRLESVHALHLGVKTGANEVFLDPENVEPELLRWAVRGRDVSPFSVRPAHRFLWTHDATGAPLSVLPPRAFQHLTRHRDRLRARADYQGGPPWMVFRVAAAQAVPRVVWADLAPRLGAAPLIGRDAREMIPLNTCYVIATGTSQEALCLCAWLNASWIRAAARAVADPASGGFARFNARAVGALPLPPAAVRDPLLVSLATRGMLGEPIQEAIDDRAAEILGLCAATRRALADLVGASAPHRR